MAQAGIQKVHRTNNANSSRKYTIIPGIQGIAPGGAGTIILPANRRWHGWDGFCSAVNYTGGVGLATKKITGAGNDALTVTLLTNGFGDPIAPLAVVAGGAGYAVNDTFTITDATGTGIVCLVTAVAGGVVTTCTINNVGTDAVADQVAIDPNLFFDTFEIKVNAVSMRNVSIKNYLRLGQARRLNSGLGYLPVEFTEASINFLGTQDATAWDLQNNEKFELVFKVNKNIRKPAFRMKGSWDNISKGPSNGKVVTPFRNPVKFREFTNVNLAIGDNPFNHNQLVTSGEPIRRIWILGSTPGNITKFQITADSDLKLEGEVPDQLEKYSQYGFEFGRGNFLNTNQPTSNALKKTFNPVSYYDAAYIGDFTGRTGEKLIYGNEILYVITSAVAQTATILFETLPGAFR